MLIGEYMFNNIVLFGDIIGLPQLLEIAPIETVKGIVISSIRPQYFEELGALAKKHNLPLLYQPKYGTEEYNLFLAQFKKNKFDLLLCNCYSMIIRKEMLESVNYNAINVHWALLPKNRGPNPTQWAIIRGENSTGVTIHYINETIDAGDIISQIEEPISITDSWVSVNKRLELLAKKLLKKVLPEVLNGNASRMKQDELKATINFRLTPNYPKIDFTTMSNQEIYNLIRAQVKPLKGAYYVDQRGNRINFDNYVPLKDIETIRSQYGN